MTATQRRAFIAANLRFPQALSADSALVKQFGVLNSGFSRRLDPSLSIPESYQTNVGVERQIGKRLVFEANYTWNRSLHLWREFNVNAPRLPQGFDNFTDYLASRDFTNFLSRPGGVRPLLNTSTAGDLVRFVLAPPDPANPNSVIRVIEFGVPVSLINLNAFTSTTSVDAALAALSSLRPDPSRGEIEQLIPVGNSQYHGFTLELRHGHVSAKNGAGFSFRGVYTLSFLRDDGIVNTSDALVARPIFGESSLAVCWIAATGLPSREPLTCRSCWASYVCRQFCVWPRARHSISGWAEPIAISTMSETIGQSSTARSVCSNGENPVNLLTQVS
jgi:hypothetical protein